MTPEMIHVLRHAVGAHAWDLRGEPPRRDCVCWRGDPAIVALVDAGLMRLVTSPLLRCDEAAFTVTDLGVEAALRIERERRTAAGLRPWLVTWRDPFWIGVERVLWARSRSAAKWAMLRSIREVDGRPVADILRRIRAVRA